MGPVPPGFASVTISASEKPEDLAPALAEGIWREVARVAALLGLPPLPGRGPAVPVVKERRATISQTAGAIGLSERRPFANVTLAGDWLAAPGHDRGGRGFRLAAVEVLSNPGSGPRAAERPMERDVGSYLRRMAGGLPPPTR